MTGKKQQLVVAYIRVASSAPEDLQGSRDGQAQKIKQYCDGHFGQDSYEFVLFEDLGVSGNLGLRQHSAKPGSPCRMGLSDAIDRLVAEATHRPAHLVCADRTRLARNVTVLEQILSVLAAEPGIHVHLVAEGGEHRFEDTERLWAPLRELVGQFDRRWTQERCRQAVARRRAASAE